MSVSFDFARSLLRTQPIVLDQSSVAEVHILVGEKQFWSCLLALKSLLRFYRHVNVAIHCDGTMTSQHEGILKKHFQGIRMISRRIADNEVGKALRDFPTCREFRSKNVVMSQVFDFAILSSREKIIGMDSDIIFLKNPKEVIQWIEDDKQQCLYTFEKLPFCPRIGRQYITQLHSHGFNFAPHLCGGFLCTFKSLLNLSLLERYCQYVKANCTDKLYRAQTMNALLLANTENLLLPATYQNFDEFTDNPPAVMRHYWLSDMGEPNWKSYIDDARRVRFPYELYGRAEDGWTSPSTMIHVFDPEPRLAKLNLEIPGWLPFEFPAVVKAVQNQREVAAVRASRPGTYSLKVPIVKRGIIEIMADQWFVPEELGISKDARRISYRLISIEDEGGASFAIGDHLEGPSTDLSLKLRRRWDHVRHWVKW
jgi:hypothetical protein